VAAALAKGLRLAMPSSVRETHGAGLEGVVDGRAVRVGSHQLVAGGRRPSEWATRVLRRANWRSALSVFIAVDGRLAGAMLLGDELRRDTPRAIQSLRTSGVARIIMVATAPILPTIGAALDLDAVPPTGSFRQGRCRPDRALRFRPDGRRRHQRRACPAAADVGIASARGASARPKPTRLRPDRVSLAVAIARRHAASPCRYSSPAWGCRLDAGGALAGLPPFPLP
jgi:hypothetical protein